MKILAMLAQGAEPKGTRRTASEGRPCRKTNWLEAEDDAADHIRAVQVIVYIGVVTPEERVAVGR